MKGFLSLMTVCILSTAAFAGEKFAPPEGRTLLFVGQDLDTIDAYLKDHPVMPAGLMGYTSLQNLEGIDERYDDGGGVMHAQALVEKYPGTAIQIGLYMVDQLDGAASGHYDDRIDKLGEWIRSSNRPVFLRVGYEFDNPGNHYDPAHYIQAYRRVVDRLREKRVTNVAFVWHSFSQGNTDRMMEWYPGDKYVDWVGASYFGQFPKFIERVSAVADKLGKPLMLAETSSWYIHNDAQRQIFFKRLFAFIDRHNVGALCYIAANWNAQPMWQQQRYGDGRVSPYPEVFAIWKEQTSRDAFLKSSPELYRTIGFRPKS